MQQLSSFALSADAELARAALEAAGIGARVADYSAMREMADYRLMVAEGDTVEAAELLGLKVPEVSRAAPQWTEWASIAAGAVIVIGILIAIFG